MAVRLVRPRHFALTTVGSPYLHCPSSAHSHADHPRHRNEKQDIDVLGRSRPAYRSPEPGIVADIPQSNIHRKTAQRSLALAAASKAILTSIIIVAPSRNISTVIKLWGIWLIVGDSGCAPPARG